MNMKFVTISGLCLAVAATAWGQGSDAPAPAAATAPAAGLNPPGKFTDEQLTEEFGWWLAKRLALTEVPFTPAERDAVMKGLGEALAGAPPPYDLDKAGPPMNELMNSLQSSALTGMKSRNQTEAQAYFAKLKDNKNVVFTPSGLAYEILAPGSGPYPTADDTVRVNYTGRLLNGTVFDSSAQHGGPAEFALKGVIPGWTEGIQKINKGGKIRLYIPSNLAYGDNGTQGIPPASALVFDVELVDFKPAATEPPAAAHP
ncbi:MAG TPA: FKBP-type peptidyl-prolyl cis-trans isomerase [Opitutaceae bacterium]|jgi:FKBP-type peptidyl-prolyl cis-trans isomerase|nr:FKBP-type peptidyl-prolyl cis-trans isomerase [Opitutaceae bacterium]